MNARTVPLRALCHPPCRLVLLAWFGLELVTSAGLAGLAERVLGEAQSAWPFMAVMSCHRPVSQTERGRLLHGYR
ncbi:MAG TPA: hypothetical protein VFO01_17685 [Trebonia sp.]|nr:hypothetical protein [Trebonia sp.]